MVKMSEASVLTSLKSFHILKFTAMSVGPCNCAVQFVLLWMGQGPETRTDQMDGEG